MFVRFNKCLLAPVSIPIGEPKHPSCIALQLLSLDCIRLCLDAAFAFACCLWQWRLPPPHPQQRAEASRQPHCGAGGNELGARQASPHFIVNPQQNCFCHQKETHHTMTRLLSPLFASPSPSSFLGNQLGKGGVLPPLFFLRMHFPDGGSLHSHGNRKSDTSHLQRIRDALCTLHSSINTRQMWTPPFTNIHTPQSVQLPVWLLWLGVPDPHIDGVAIVSRL